MDDELVVGVEVAVELDRLPPPDETLLELGAMHIPPYGELAVVAVILLIAAT